MWGCELLSLLLGLAAGWGFPPEAAVGAGWCWVLGFGALRVMLEMVRWSIASVMFAGVLVSAVLGVHRHH